MFWDSVWFQFGVLLALSVGAHMGVAYGLAPRAAVKRVELWFDSPIGQATIGKAVDGILVPRLSETMKEIPTMDAIEEVVAAGIASIPSPKIPEVPTKDELREMIEEATPGPEEISDLVKASVPDSGVIAKAISDQMQLAFMSKAGNAARGAQSSLEKIILGMSTGNPLVDGALAMIPLDVKKEWAKRISSAIRKGGTLAEPSGEEADQVNPSSSGEWVPGTWR